jgi:hypothetical protein
MHPRLRAIGLSAVVAVAATACTSASERRVPAPSAPSSAQPSREARWAADIAYLLDHMEHIHPDLYHGVSREALHAAADALVDELPGLDDDQLLVGVMHLVALVSSRGRDGHMGIWPPDNGASVHRYPLRLWEFPDGIRVTAGMPPLQDLIGARVVGVDGVPIDEVLSRLDPVVPRDNDSNLRAARLVYLTSAEVLAGLGIAHDAVGVVLQVKAGDGTERSVAVAPVDAATYADWVGGWELPLPERGGAMWLRHLDAEHAVTYLPSSRALYVQYNHVLETSADAVAAVRRAMRAHTVGRLILDLRNNGGGEAEGYDDLVRFLASPSVARLAATSVLIGRLTFSAAASFVAELERSTAPITLVGEATGGAPNFWADPVTVTLPNSGLRALVSETYEGYGKPGDPRLSMQPTVSAPLSWDDYAAGRDPVLAAALARPIP